MRIGGRHALRRGSGQAVACTARRSKTWTVLAVWDAGRPTSNDSRYATVHRSTDGFWTSEAAVAVKRVRVVVGGVVQGVGFRYFAKREADRHRLIGFVRNRPDGRVEVEVEGDERSVDDYLATLRAGPRSGYVAQFDVQEMEAMLTGSHFEIRF